jgi:hypothetical protein
VSDYGKLVREALAENECEFIRHGKGDHDIWECTATGKRFPVDHKIKSRHTANGILKLAGIPKKF